MGTTDDAGTRALAAAGLTLAALKEALRAEEAARLSAEVQAEYGAVEDDAAGADGSDWLAVTAALQERVLRAAGVPARPMEAALFALRGAAQLFPDDAELQRISLYVRHNRARHGTLQPGDTLPDVPLFALDAPADATDAADAAGGARTSLRAACAGAQPTLLVAGSWT